MTTDWGGSIVGWGGQVFGVDLSADFAAVTGGFYDSPGMRGAPDPTGACCFDAAPYCEVMSEADCEALPYGSTASAYMGDDTPCDTDDCDSDGIPDDCAVALGLVDDCNDNLIPDECDVAVCTDCADIFIGSGGTAPSGYYDIYPDGQTHINAYCHMTEDRGWTVIDPNHDADWGQFFSTWDIFADGLVRGYGDSWKSWREWFLLADAQTEFALSPDCHPIGDVNQVYRMTGNFYGCTWWNGNCDFDGTCHLCLDPLGRLLAGTCPWLWGEGITPDYTYPEICSWDWWNTAPSLGQDGTHCVAYTDSEGGCSLDCNTNGIPDECDIASGASADCNSNGIPDECEAGPIICGGIDIKPGSCPNSFNRSGHGVLPVALWDSPGFDVTLVDVSSVRLRRADGVGGEVAPHEGPPGPHSVVEDVATPFESDQWCQCTDAGGDGLADLSMKFESDDVVEALQLNDLDPGALVELVITGNLVGGAPIEAASDCIRLVPPGTLPGLLSIQSNVPDLWVELDPLDDQLDGGGFTPFERTFPQSSVVTLTASEVVADTVPFQRWVVDGVPQPVGVRTIDLTVAEDSHSLVARYVRPPKTPGTADSHQAGDSLGTGTAVPDRR